MEDFGAQRREMDNKLQRELEKLDVVKELMGRSSGLTDNMMTILTSFETRLSKLEDTINPVYQETGNLQRRHEHVEKTLTHLDHVIGYYHVTDEMDPVIREGPNNGLDNYLECMAKLHKAVDFFNKNNSGSAEMSHVTTLYEVGKDSLEKEFRTQLSRHSKPVPPVLMLDAITVDEELDRSDSGLIEQLPERVKKDLQKIASWLLSCGYHTDYMTVYGSTRSSILVKSLTGLKDHLKAGSKDSASMTISHPSPSMAAKVKSGKDTPGKKSKISLVKNASASMMAAGFKLGGSSTTDVNEGVEVDTNFFVLGVSALLKLMQSEVALMEGIIPAKHQHQVFERIIQASMNSIEKEGQQMIVNMKNAFLRHDHSAVLSIFPVLKHLHTVKPQFDEALKSCTGSVKGKLDSLVLALQQTGAKGLEEFVENVKGDPGKSTNMPKDGTVHELTNNTIIFLEQLLDFWEPAGAMLMAQGSSVVASRISPTIAKKRVSEFITRVLSSLALNLKLKSETYPDPTMRAIFMLNNNNYILKSLKREEIITIARIHSKDILNHYVDEINQQKRVYSQSWSRVMHYISDRSSLGTRAPDEKLKDKDRQAIKDRFTGFNKEMEELYRVQKNYAIPDTELRDTLRKDNREFIVPEYKKFMEKHRHINFTKNRDKYFRFSVEDVTRMINNFFDSAA